MAGKSGSPLISVITVCRNAQSVISRCFNSLQQQSFRDWEHIVIDGDSTDQTASIIRRSEAALAYWSSEPDTGIANAMNKGLRHAHGQWILFLNADDYLEDPEALSRIAPHLDQTADICAFDIWMEKDGNRWRRAPRGFSWRLAFKTTVFHQASLCRRSLFESLGAFDEQFRIAMDYDFFYRAWRAKIRARYVANTFSVMQMTGVSSQTDWQSLQTRFSEERKVHMKNCPNKKMRFIYSLYWLLYLPYRRLRFATTLSASPNQV